MEGFNEEEEEGRRGFNMVPRNKFDYMEIQENGEDFDNFNEDEFFGYLEEESQQKEEILYKGQSKKERLGMGGRQHSNDMQQMQKKKNNKIKKLEALPLSKKLMIYLLRFTFESNHGQDMNQKYAEDRIFRELKNNGARAISFLIEIINDPSENAIQNISQQQSNQLKIKQPKHKMATSDLVKTSAAIQLGQINRNALSQINMSEEDKLTLIQGIMIILCNQSNCPQIKKHISKALTSILEQENSEIKDTIFGFIHKLLQSGQLDKQIGSMLCIEAIIMVPLNEAQIQFILNNFFDALFYLGGKLYQMCNEELLQFQMALNQAKQTYVKQPDDWDDETIDKYKVSSQTLEDKLTYLENWSVLINRILGLLSFKKQTLSNEASFTLLNNGYYFDTMAYMISMQLQIEEQISDCLISFSTSYSLDSQLNSNLVNYLKIISRFIKLLLRHRNQDYSLPENLKNTPFCIMLKQLIPKSVLSLKGLNQFLIKYSQLYNEYKVEETKNQIMHIVKQSLKISELQNYFFDMRVSFMCDYIAPLLMVTDNDFEDFKKFGTSYLQYLHEFLNLQDKDKNKTSASNLIIRYCKYVHGALTFFVTFFLENIHSMINNIPCNDPQFQVLNQAFGSLIKQKYEVEKQFDMSLVALISVRKQVKQRKDLLELVDRFFINNCDMITNTNEKSVSNFAISQILLFFTEMSDSILLNHQDVFMRYIGLLLECTQDWNSLQGFQFQAYKNLYDISKCKATNGRLKQDAYWIYQTLLEQIERRHKCDIYFESLNAVVQQFRDQIFLNEDVLYNLINILISKIFQSCLASKNKSKMHLEGVKNPLCMLELIVQWEGLSDQIAINIDTYLQPLYQTLQTSKDHDLSVSILKILRLQIQRMNGVKTEIALQTLFLMKDVYEKEDIFVFEIYKIINFLIQKQPDYLVQNQTLFKFVIL